jgi:hypothetical protein
MSNTTNPNTLYQLTYYTKFPPPFCEGMHESRINGVCTDLSKYAADVRDNTQSSGACPPMNKQVGNLCMPTNETYTTAMPGYFSLGQTNQLFGQPMAPATACCTGGCVGCGLSSNRLMNNSYY